MLLTDNTLAVVGEVARDNAGATVLAGAGRTGHVGTLTVQPCKLWGALTPAKKEWQHVIIYNTFIYHALQITYDLAYNQSMFGSYFIRLTYEFYQLLVIYINFMIMKNFYDCLIFVTQFI